MLVSSVQTDYSLSAEYPSTELPNNETCEKTMVTILPYLLVFCFAF